MSLGIWELVVILAIVFIMFGAGKLPKVMGELGSGIKALRNNLNDDKPQPLKKKAKKSKATTTIK